MAENEEPQEQKSSPMDKEWDKLFDDLEKVQVTPSFHEMQGTQYKTENIKAKDFGIGAAMMAKYADPLQGLQAEIRGGASHIEFSPSISQGQGVKSFTMISKEKRQALKELRQVNEVTMTTHAHAGVTGLTGFDRQSYTFNDQQRKSAIDEIKKAIDFAADVAEGGAITFHAGDFARPLSGQEFDRGAKFEMHPDELQQMLFVVIDKENKRPAQNFQIHGGQKLTATILSEETKPISGFKNIEFHEPMRDKENNPIHLEFNNFREYAAYLLKNVPKFRAEIQKIVDPEEKGNIKIDDFIKQKSNEKEEVFDYRILEKAAQKKFTDDMENNLKRNLHDNKRNFITQISDLENAEKAIQNAKKDSKNGKRYIAIDHQYRDPSHPLTEEEKNNLIQKSRGSDEDFIIIENGEIITKDKSLKTFYGGPVEVEKISDVIGELKFDEKSRENQLIQEKNKLKDNRYATVSEFAHEQNKESFAELGIELYHKNKQLQKKDSDAPPLFFAIENIFPEHYGASPEELLNVIKQAREGMAEGLQKRQGMDKTKAEKIAEDSIKATFDTGHLHMWKKYFKRDEKENEETYNKRFNDWAIGQTKKLIDAKVIGNIHLADNFGFDDDHLTAGQGDVPLQKYLEMFDKAVKDKNISEKIRISVEGFDESGERHGVHEAWKASGAQLFKGQVATDRWTNPSAGGSSYSTNSMDRLDSYSTGNYNKPSFIFGKYVPDREEWAPWSDTTLE